MKIKSYLFLFLSTVLFYSSSIAMHRIAGVITQARRMADLRAEREAPVVDVSEFDPAIGAVELLPRACKSLHMVPGTYDSQLGPLYIVLNYGKKGFERHHSNARGAMYELEKALELRDNGHEIVCCRVVIDGREFDLLVNTPERQPVLIECKNIIWETYQVEKVGKQLLDQLRISRELDVRFELYSRRAIPLEHREWLERMGIPFVVG